MCGAVYLIFPPLTASLATTAASGALTTPRPWSKPPSPREGHELNKIGCEYIYI